MNYNVEGGFIVYEILYKVLGGFRMYEI